MKHQLKINNMINNIAKIIIIQISFLPFGLSLIAQNMNHVDRNYMKEGRLAYTLSGEGWTVVSADSGIGETNRYFANYYPSSQAIQAKVPGDINWDLMRSAELPDIFIGMNAKKAYPYARKEWWYRKTFIIPKKAWGNKRIRLNFAAVDYAAKIWLNGQFLGSHKGQFTPFEFEISDKISYDKENELIVLIEPAPKNIIDAFVHGDRWANNSYKVINETLKYWKCHTMTGWDWGTRLWSMGIWQDVTLTATSRLYLDRLLIFPETNAPYQQAKLNIKLDVNTTYSEDVELSYTAECINAKAPKASGSQTVNTGSVKKQIEGSLAIKNPALWWPNGYGKQNLYLLTVTAKDKKTGKVLDQISSRFGIREIKMLENPGASDYIQPAKPAKYLYLAEINGQRIFLHGGNWLPADLLYGRPGKREYEHLIRMASLANYNVFRIWGGGLIDKQIFYDLCDQYGILIYQEMPHGFAAPLETTEILANVAKEQRQVMPLLINHPSLFRYGFGNELAVTRENSMHVRQFENICAEIDPTRAVNGSDPVPGYQRHGPYYFRFPGVYNQYNTGLPIEYFNGPVNPVENSEYGTSGASSIETIKRVIPEEKNRWPISSLDGISKVNPVTNGTLPTAIDSIWRWHNGLQAFDPLCWLVPDTYRGLFGELPVPDLETEIKMSQFVQAEGLRYANQSQRRAKWHRSGCFMWTFNEPWPNVAHGSIVEYYGLPKMAFYYVRNSYAQVNVSVKYNTIVLHPADTLKLPIFATNAKPKVIKEATLITQIAGLNGKVYYKSRKEVIIDAVSSHKIDSLSFIVPQDANNNVLLVRLDLLDDKNRSLSCETYTFGVKNPPPEGKDKAYMPPMFKMFAAPMPEDKNKAYMRPMLDAPQAQLKLSVKYYTKEQWGDDKMDYYQALVKNTSKVPALFVQLKCNHKPDEVYIKDNYFTLLPGEERMVDILVSPNVKNDFKADGIVANAWNSDK